MRPTRRGLGILVAACFAAIGATPFVLAASQGQPTQPSTSQLSSQDIQDRDAAARAELSRVRSAVAYHALLPALLPAGYTYAQVIYDGTPQGSFSVFIAGPDSSTRELHMDEGPAVPIPPGSKDPVRDFALQLQPVAIAGHPFLSMQKPNEPYKGIWFFVGDELGVRITVDGYAPRSVIEQFIAGLS